GPGRRAGSIGPAEFGPPGDEKRGRSPRRMHLVRKPLCEDPFSLNPRGFRGRLIAAVRRRGSRARRWPRLRFCLVQAVLVVALLLAVARLPQRARGRRDYVSAPLGLG